MKRKWTKVLAVMLAATMAVPTALPANMVSAASIDSVSNKKNQSSDYTYSQIGNTGYYVEYLSSYDLVPGNTVTITPVITKKTSEGQYIAASAEEIKDFTYSWKRYVQDADGTLTMPSQVTATDSSFVCDSSSQNYVDNKGQIALTVKSGTATTNVYYYINLDSVYTISDGAYESEGSHASAIGKSVTLNGTIYAKTGFSVSYKWQKYDVATTSVQDIAGATGATYVATPAVDTDYTSYYCVATIKNAAGIDVTTVTLNYSLYETVGAQLYYDYHNYEKHLGDALNLSLNYFTYDTAKYTVKYAWTKNGSDEEALIKANTTNQLAIANIVKTDFALYACKATLYKVTDTTFTDPVKSYSVSYDVEEYTGLWAYAGAREKLAAMGTATTLDVYASNVNATAYPITYQWAKYNNVDEDYVNLDGQTGTSYSLPALTEEQFGDYRVAITDGVENYYVYYTLTEDTGWKVISPSASQSYNKIGDTVNLSVSVESAAAYPVRYMWKDQNGEAIVGANTASCSVVMENDDSFGTYSCKAWNGKKSTTFTFSIYQDDNFYVDTLTASSLYKSVGGSAVFQVRPHSEYAGATFEYQWYFSAEAAYIDGSQGYDSMPGQTSDTLNIASITNENFGEYYVKVKDVATGSYKSVYFNLNNAALQNIQIDYATDSVFDADLGTAVTMGVAPSYNPGNAPLSYKWFSRDNDGNYHEIGANTTANWTIPSLVEGQYGSYRCVVLSNDMFVDYLDFVIEKDTASYLEVKNTTDFNQEITMGAAVTMAVAATTKTGRTLSYQWYDYSTDNAIMGATGASYTIAAFRRSDIKRYYCVVKDSQGESNSVRFSLSLKTGLGVSWDGGTDYSTIVGKAATYGKALKLKVTATNDANYPTYFQWYYNKDSKSTYSHNAIADATAATYNIAAVNKDTVGYYTCEIRNHYNTYTTGFYVYADTGLSVKATETDFMVQAGSKVDMSATATCSKGYNITYQWYKYQPVKTVNGSSVSQYSDYKKIDGATTNKYSIASVGEKDFTQYALKVSTEGENYTVYYNVDKKGKLYIKKTKCSTDVTLPGSKITLQGTVTAPKDAKVEYQWFVEDAATGSYKKAVTTAKKDATAAKVTVKAPSVVNPEDPESSEYQTIMYRLEVTSVIDGVTTNDYEYISIMVVNPTYSKKLIKSAHNYKTNHVTVYGYKATGTSIASLKAKFSAKTNFDKNGDCAYLVDGNGKATKYYGTELANKTVKLAGSKFAVVIISVNKDAKAYGFDVSKVSKFRGYSLNKTKVTMGVKEKFKIKVYGAPKKKITYKSTKKKVATVSKKGVILAKNTGKTVIKVKSGSKTLKLNVTVKQAPKKLKVAKKKVTVKRGKSATVKYSIQSEKSGASGASGVTVTNAKVLKKAKVTVSTSGSKVKIKVAKKAKKKTYKVTIATYNKKKATIKVKVK